MKIKICLTSLPAEGTFRIAISHGQVPLEDGSCPVLVADSSTRKDLSSGSVQEKSPDDSEIGPFTLVPGECAACYWPSEADDETVAVCTANSTNSGPGVIELDLYAG